MEHYHLTVFFAAKDETSAKEFVKELEETGISDAVRGEDGCLRYDFYFDAKDPKTVLLLEEWESEKHQQIHITQPHMAKMRAVKERYIQKSDLIILN